eukprot:CAMPEP_0172485812 /NCGR_PEP_ID=MMETSP1066-20121228/14016_1 /TAXON_ID=671091 /ORGANISM="Coscinodiscus wailesii, Strain CCMP2513" /LENGTH=56 /DNA_ID=CAMNT_0013251299 /DNA_START=88 /DNA_END=254 /DNA_ORIENTATION=+
MSYIAASRIAVPSASVGVSFVVAASLDPVGMLFVVSASVGMSVVSGLLIMGTVTAS